MTIQLIIFLIKMGREKWLILSLWGRVRICRLGAIAMNGED